MKKLSPILQALVPLFFLIPACSIVGMFVIYPAFKAIYLSFTNFNMISEASFIGLDNYRKIIADPFFTQH